MKKNHFSKKADNEVTDSSHKSRRDFISFVVKTALPTIAFLGLGGVGAASAMKNKMEQDPYRHNSTEPNDCSLTCEGGCRTTCDSGCLGTCEGECFATCKGGCRGSCEGSCKTTCEGFCTGGCEGCKGSCSGGCSGGAW